MTEDKPKFEKQSDKAVFTLGRINPPTSGHLKLINAVKEYARRTGADHHVFVTHTQDAKKNPLTHKQKLDFINKMMPGTNVHEEAHIKNAIHALEHLHKEGYTKATMLVGSDRVQEFANLLHKYNPGIKDLEVKSAGDRDPDAEGVEGISASKMREHAVKKNFKEFSKGVPVKKYAKELYKATRKGMKLESYQAVILVGGPGSGKDFILRSALNESGAVELPVGSYLDSATSKPINNPPMIMNGNAYDYDRIVLEAAKLEEHGYKVAMVYVYTTNEDSQERNEARIRKGEKTITEAHRATKYAKSVENMHDFNALFSEGFFLFNNSDNFVELAEDKKQQVVSWIQELAEGLEQYFNPDIDTLFVEAVKEISQTEVAGIDKKVLKGRPKKEANPAPDYTDSRLGTVPGIAFGVSESKSFSKFREGK